MKRIFTYKILWLFLLLPMFSGCNDSDDLQAIFTGKTWRLTYINLKDKGGWMEGFSEESFKIFNTNKESYTIVFNSGNEENNKITGNITGKIITANLSGTFSANGKSNQFSTNIPNISESDALAKEYLKGLSSANSYSGDTQNLFLYYKPSGSQQTYVLAFHVK